MVAVSSAKKSVTYVIITDKKRTILQAVKPEKDIQSSRSLNAHRISRCYLNVHCNIHRFHKH